jgi:hypothetical protein
MPEINLRATLTYEQWRNTSAPSTKHERGCNNENCYYKNKLLIEINYPQNKLFQSLF